MSLHNDNALVVALDTSTDMLACAASWITAADQVEDPSDSAYRAG